MISMLLYRKISSVHLKVNEDSARYAHLFHIDRIYSYERLLMKIKAIIWQEDGVWCGSVPALPGCHTWGESYEHLLEILEDAVQGWLEVASQQNELASDK